MNLNIFDDYQLIRQLISISRAIHQHYGIILFLLLVLAQASPLDLWEKYTKSLILFNSMEK